MAATSTAKTGDSVPIKPDTALIQHISGVDSPEEPFPSSPANCLVFWARPPHYILQLIQSLQSRLSSLVGNDLYLIPFSHIHLSVLELSHKHSISHLRGIYNAIGQQLLQKMLDLPLLGDFGSEKRASAPWLVKPQLMMDDMGVAVTFVPDCDSLTNEGESDAPEKRPFTYHHLRASLHALALASGVEIDTCYTAATAHITIARFVSSGFFDSSDRNRGNAAGSRPLPTTQPTSSLSSNADGDPIKSERISQWVELIQEVNRHLREQSEHLDMKSELEWAVGRESRLEVQLGYIKFGREAAMAEMVGPSIVASPSLST